MSGSLRKTAALVLLATPALAQEPPDSARLSPIVVTGTRVPTRADRLPQRVTVLSGEELRGTGVTTVADALRTVAGLTVVPTGAPGAATSVFVRGGESDYVKVLVDGVPLNEPGGFYDFAHLTLDNVERIEVLRGPASVLYGSDAVSGVVQVFTRDRGRRLEAGARAGTLGTVEADASVESGGPAAGLALGARWTGSDGLYDFNNRYENRTLSARARLAPDSATDVRLTLRLSDADYHYPTDGAGIPVDRNQHQLTETTTLGLDLARRLGRRLEARLALTSNEIGGGFDDAPDGPGDTLGSYAFRSQRDLVRRGADGRLHVSPVDRVWVIVGGAFEHERERSTSRSDGEFGPFETRMDAERDNWAGYLQLAADAGPAAVTAGARLDRNERFGTFVTWRSGASLRLPAGVRFFGSVGSAFKAPLFFEQFGGTFVIGNPDLDPERSVSWEGGVEQAVWDGRLRVSATYFGQRFEDLIQYTFTPLEPGGPNYVNVAAARADGVELEARGYPLRGLSVGVQYTWLSTEVTDVGTLPADDAAFRLGDRLLRRPAHTVTLDAHADLGRLRVGGAVRRIGARADADFAAFPAVRLTLPAHTVLDLGGEVELPRLTPSLPALVLTGRVENALDHDYQEVYGFPARGRVVLVGGRVRM
ncbi:MAG TPA: TonB-dependent receptor [Gemmatimonadales bacterium]|nr:TonB-dependent receptor [Gemmatimonadales bacterium]